MTATVDRTALTRRVHFHDPDAPAATVVVPAVFVAVRRSGGRLLLVRRIRITDALSSDACPHLG